MAMSRPLDDDDDPFEMMGSEAFYELFCDMCSEAGKHLEAEGYCNDCKDYLCSECIGIHRRTRLTLNHQITTKIDMPKVKPEAPPVLPMRNHLGTKPCSVHRQKYIEYYCENHSFFGCHACITVDHRNCEDVHFLPDVTDGLTDSKEFKGFVDKVEAVQKVSHTLVQTVRTKQAESNTNYTDVLNEITQVRKDINDALDKIESHVRDRADSFRALNDRKLKKALEYCRKTSRYIQRLKSEIKQLKEADQMSQLFVFMKESEGKLEPVMKTIQKGTLTLRKFVFKPDTRLPTLLKEVDAFGRISLQRSEVQTSIQNQGNVTDHSVEELLKYIGIEGEVDEETIDFIKDFISKHGGMDTMKREMDKYESSKGHPPPPPGAGSRVPSPPGNWKYRCPPPPSRVGPPPPPPNRNGPPPPPPSNKDVKMPPPPTRVGPPPPPPGRVGPPPPPPGKVKRQHVSKESIMPPPPPPGRVGPPPPSNKDLKMPPPPTRVGTGKVWPPPPPPP